LIIDRSSIGDNSVLEDDRSQLTDIFVIIIIIRYYYYRSSIGDNSVLEDDRWGGLYGLDVDFVAEENCKTVSISKEDIQA
jgi:hypothetical protein